MQLSQLIGISVSEKDLMSGEQFPGTHCMWHSIVTCSEVWSGFYNYFYPNDCMTHVFYFIIILEYDHYVDLLVDMNRFSNRSN